jgi:hypothetical protein
MPIRLTHSRPKEALALEAHVYVEHVVLSTPLSVAALRK